MNDVKFKEVKLPKKKIKETEFPVETIEQKLERYVEMYSKITEQRDDLRKQIKLKNSIIKQYEKFLSGEEL